MPDYDVIIIGAGLSGLSTALYLESKNINYIILEKENTVGGRQKTVLINDYICDAGFQVIFKNYSELKHIPNINSLDTVKMKQGAKCWHNNRFHLITNPLYHPFEFIRSYYNNLLHISDYKSLGKYIYKLTKKDIKDIFSEVNDSTVNKINQLNVSKNFKNHFLYPFFKGVFLDDSLHTSSRLFDYYFKYFYESDVLIPKEGIQALPNLIVSQLSAPKVRLNSDVTNIQNNTVTINDKEKLTAKYICCATDSHTANSLFNIPKTDYHNVFTFYFSTPSPPFKNKWLYLDGSHSPINNFYNVTATNPKASPKPYHLLSFSSIPTKKHHIIHENEILNTAKNYFGNNVETWTLVKKFSIKQAIPQQPISYNQINTRFNSENVYFCGDWTIQGSINGALYSGRRIAQEVCKLLS